MGIIKRLIIILSLIFIFSNVITCTDNNIDEDSKEIKQIIDQCSVYLEGYMPNDFAYAFNNRDYNKILGTNKFNDILSNENVYDNYGEIDIHSIISFKSKNHIITNCSLNLMQSGFSRRSWSELPINTYKGNGRVRHERLNIQVGPLMNVQIHSYQAYEVKDRDEHGGDSIGELEHFDIYIFRNTDLIGGKPFEKIKLSNIDYSYNETEFIGYNERAREVCFNDFIANRLNESNILFHKESIEITEKIYESLVYGGKKMEFDYKIEKMTDIVSIGIITDNDFDIKEKQSTEPPLIRFGARGIVENSNGQIAIIHKKNKNEYKLPGGGIDNNEEASVAFMRECEEELGIKINNIKELGVIEENKSQENFKQLSFVFVAEKYVDLDSTSLTQKEIEEGTEYLWLSKTEALTKVKESLNQLKASKYDSLYRTKFMVLRDIKILEYYIDNKLNV